MSTTTDGDRNGARDHDRIGDGLDAGRLVAAALGEAATEPVAESVTAIRARGSRGARADERPRRRSRRRRPRCEEKSAAPAPEPAPARSKAKMAKDAAESDRPKLVVGKTPGVLPDDHLAEAGRKVLRFHLARMITKEAGTRDGKDAEDLHAMRVATRRQRAAWRIFGEAFRAGRTKPHRGRLREVASRLGAVRDLDVLLEAADAYRADLAVAEQRGLEPLLAAWRIHRDDARTLLVRELDSDGYRRWLDDYAEFVRHDGSGRPARRPDRAAPRPRHRRLADPGRVRAGPRVRAGAPLGRRGDAPRASDRRQVAALHAGVRPRCPRARSAIR